MTRPLKVEPPKDHPRWDGERIRPYGTDADAVMWDDDNGWEDEE